MHRVLRGAYAKTVGTDGDDVWTTRRNEWLTKTRAALALYAQFSPVLYGPTALQALRVALPQRLEDWSTIHILIRGVNQRRRRDGVVLHYTTKPVTIWRKIDGLPVLNPVDHWLQLAGASLDEMIEVGDGLVRRRNPLLKLSQMHARLDQLAGTPHAKLARRAIESIRPGTESIFETRVRLIIVHAGLPEPEVSPGIWFAGGGFTLHPDMGYTKAKVAVEFDGMIHVNSRQHMDEDAARRNHYLDAGWQIITVTASHLQHPESWLRSIETALIIRGETS